MGKEKNIFVQRLIKWTHLSGCSCHSILFLFFNSTDWHIVKTIFWLKMIIWVTGVLRRTVVGDYILLWQSVQKPSSESSDYKDGFHTGCWNVSPTTVLLGTPINQMIILNQGMLLLGSNHFFFIYIEYCISSKNQTGICQPYFFGSSRLRFYSLTSEFIYFIILFFTEFRAEDFVWIEWHN